MTPKHLCILVLAIVAIGGAAAQNDDIPIENDNQFPPENPSKSENDIIDGSGDVAVEGPPTFQAGAVEGPPTSQAEATSAPPTSQAEATSAPPTSQAEATSAPSTSQAEATSEHPPSQAETTSAPPASQAEATSAPPTSQAETTSEHPTSQAETTSAPPASQAEATSAPPTSQTEAISAPQLEEVQPTAILSETTTTEDQSCPSPCVCHYEGGPDNFIVDCAGYELAELPSPIDPKTIELYLQNNKLTEIPKDVSTLKNLRVLNAENNSVMNLALGSVSELPELNVLKLGNNRLIEYPQDLKNSLSLSKLEELDLGGNDMRTDLKGETFSNFKALRKLTLATSNPNLLEDLCKSLKTTLEKVCTESCDKSFYECTDTPLVVDDDLIDATYPGMIPFEGKNENSDPVVQSDVTNIPNAQEPALSKDKSDTTEENILPNETSASGRALVGNTPEETTPQKLNSIVETPKEETAKTDGDVKIGAATTSTNSGGVSKSLIAIIVAGMVVVVAAITIKKNWGSIRKRFSSTPRPAERGGANANGTAPEEVPLQEKDKSPV